ncbi:MAG: acetyl-CoA carboxylase, carboxyltransferase subunit beta [Chitinivibrionales bacterium]|nr:acetyl-CoA carboxylase, carboxyltransferase subunit beta [Chitinivibrionales bacterium]
MGWFSKTDTIKKIVKNDIWIRCESCKAHVFKQDWKNNLNVCPQCNFHGTINAYERIGLIIDAGTFKEINQSITPSDPLDFVDAKGAYREKIIETREKLKLNESVVTGTGKICDIPVSLAVMDFRFFGGSLGSGTGEKILLAANYAYEHRIPFIIFSASGGARMQEGTLSLMQMAKTCAAIARLNDRKVPYISVLTHPTTGGVSASFAMVGDLNIAEPQALIGFAGRRVIEQTIKQKLPDNFQKAEFLLEHGFIDAIINRKDMKKALANILSYYIVK